MPPEESNEVERALSRILITQAVLLVAALISFWPAYWAVGITAAQLPDKPQVLVFYFGHVFFSHVRGLVYLTSCGVLLWAAVFSNRRWYERLPWLIVPYLAFVTALRFRLASGDFIREFGFADYVVGWFAWPLLPELLVVATIPIWLRWRGCRLRIATPDDDCWTSTKVSLATVTVLFAWTSLVLAGTRAYMLSPEMVEAIGLGALLCGYQLQRSIRSRLLLFCLLSVAMLFSLAVTCRYYVRRGSFAPLAQLDVGSWISLFIAHIFSVALIAGQTYLAMRPLRRIHAEVHLEPGAAQAQRDAPA
jgi:hypothetical protein